MYFVFVSVNTSTVVHIKANMKAGIQAIYITLHSKDIITLPQHCVITMYAGLNYPIFSQPGPNEIRKARVHCVLLLKPLK